MSQKVEVQTDTPVREHITAGIKAVSAQKALVTERKKVKEVKMLKSKRRISCNKSCSWSDDSDTDEPAYSNSSDLSMDVENKPTTSNFQFDNEKVNAGDYILVELKNKKGNPAHLIIKK